MRSFRNVEQRRSDAHGSCRRICDRGQRRSRSEQREERARESQLSRYSVGRPHFGIHTSCTCRPTPSDSDSPACPSTFFLMCAWRLGSEVCTVGTLPQTSNCYCHPGRAGGTPNGLGSEVQRRKEPQECPSKRARRGRPEIDRVRSKNVMAVRLVRARPVSTRRASYHCHRFLHI